MLPFIMECSVFTIMTRHTHNMMRDMTSRIAPFPPSDNPVFAKIKSSMVPEKSNRGFSTKKRMISYLLTTSIK